MWAKLNDFCETFVVPSQRRSCWDTNFCHKYFEKLPRQHALQQVAPFGLKALRNGKFSMGNLCKTPLLHPNKVRNSWRYGCETRETLANCCIRLAICCKMALQKQQAVLQLNEIENFAVGKVASAKKWQMVAKMVAKCQKQLGNEGFSATAEKVLRRCFNVAQPTASKQNSLTKLARICLQSTKKGKTVVCPLRFPCVAFVN